MHADTEVLLLPKTELLYFLTATFTLSQWVENWESHQAGEPPPNVANGCVVSGDDRDEGVVDEWPLCLAAWPVQPAVDSDGAWRLTEGAAGSDWFDIAMRPLRERSYWMSQRRGIPLPDLPPGPDPAARRVRKGRALCPPGSLLPGQGSSRTWRSRPGAGRGRQVAAWPWLAGCDVTRNAYTTVELRYWPVA